MTMDKDVLISRLSMLIGMSHTLSSCFSHEFTQGQRKVFEDVEKEINLLFYTPQFKTRWTPPISRGDELE